MDPIRSELAGAPVIVGGGLAGLMTALRLAPQPVILLAKTSLSEGAAAAEERLKEVREGMLVPAAEGRSRPERGSALGRLLFVLLPVRPEFVVFPAFLRVAQHLVGFVDRLEPGLRGLVARVQIGMELARQLSVRLLDIRVRGRLRDPERLVVIVEFHVRYGPLD